MSGEQIDVYDENMQNIGIMSRDEAHHQGVWHKTIHCWIYRKGDPGYVLFQKRGRNKALFPNALDITAAGHYLTNEGPEEGVREILEEIGLEVKARDLTSLGVKFDLAKIGKVVNREFCDVFLFENNVDPEGYNIDENEVEGLVQIKISDGLQLFGGRVEKVMAKGVEWNKGSEEWISVEMQVGVADFIPRVDPYYKKIFIIADLANKGYEHLSI